MKDLMKILHRDPDPHVRAAAARALGNQIPFAKEVARGLLPLLEDDDTDAKILEALVLTLGKLEWTRDWEAICDLITHDDDGVVIACFEVLGKWKELRAWREIQIFWDTYPEDGKFATGGVTVDTGAAGDTDQRAAKAKWKAKYGNKAKQRPRPECVQALKRAVKEMTGEELEKPAEFRVWCSDNKDQIKAAERKRD
jgi:HEAT repeat protein